MLLNALVSPLLFVSVVAISQPTAKRVWSIDAGLSQPESSYYDPTTKLIYVSNVAGEALGKDGNGWIDVFTPEGKIKQLQWVKGLNAPKGLRADNGQLWVTDIDRVLAFDLKTGKKTMELAITGAGFLNDIAATANGDVYVSDMATHKLHRIRDGKASPFAKEAKVSHPNGLFADKDFLWVASWGEDMAADFSTKKPGGIYKIDISTEKAILVMPNLGNLDGLERLNDKNETTIVSDWIAGTVFVIQNGKANLILSKLSGSADLGFIPGKNLLLVPEMLSSKLTAYQIDL